MNNGRTLLITHTDLDGISVYVLASYFKPQLKIFDFMSEDYGFYEDEKKYEHMKKFSRIIIADLSLSQKVTQELLDLGIEVIHYDHHKTSEWIKDIDNESVWDDSRSGTKIFWEEYVKPRIQRYSGVVEHFVTLVDTYDMWKTQDSLWEEARRLNNILYGVKKYTQGISFNEANHVFIANNHRKFKFDPSWRWLLKEREAFRKAEEEEESTYQKAMEELQVRTDERGKKFGVCAMRSKISFVASRITSEMPELDYIIVRSTYDMSVGRFSFRSNNLKSEEDSFDCTQISIANGHKHASGGEVSAELAKEFLEDNTLTFNYNKDYSEEKEAITRVETND